MKEIFRVYIKNVIKLYLPLLYKSKSSSSSNSIIRIGILFIGGPIIIIFLSSFFPHSQVLQIIIAILATFIGAFITFTLLTVTSLRSQIRGAEMILENPPQSGEISIRVMDDEEKIWEGNKFSFATEKPMEDLATTSVDINLSPKPSYGLPTKKREEWVKWKKTYSIIKPMITEGKSWNEIIIELETNQENLPFTKDTLSKIEKAGNDGLLDTWPPKWQSP
jgi:hypothetical protein